MHLLNSTPENPDSSRSGQVRSSGHISQSRYSFGSSSVPAGSRSRIPVCSTAAKVSSTGRRWPAGRALANRRWGSKSTDGHQSSETLRRAKAAHEALAIRRKSICDALFRGEHVSPRLGIVKSEKQARRKVSGPIPALGVSGMGRCDMRPSKWEDVSAAKL